MPLHRSIGRYKATAGGLIFWVEDGKEMQLDTEKMNIKDVMEEVDRHSRKLNRQADLLGN